MGMRINQNIGAQKALFSVRNNDATFEKHMERLSSGLRINRGADDPAGLVISEKFRSQVEGIGQAISNTKDGINLVQTAEGSLDEVSQVLRTMRNLALHAANTGPNDTAAIAADQQQISESIATLTRIGNTARFGSRKVLDGSAGVTATTSNTNVTFIAGTENTQDGSYAVKVTTAAVKGQVDSGAALTTTTITGSVAASTVLDGTTTVDVDFNGSKVSLSLDTGDDVNSLVTKLNADTNFSGAGLTASVAGGKLTIASDRVSGLGDLDVTLTAGTATNAATSLGFVNADAATTVAATGATKLSNTETLTFSNGSSTVSVALAAGQTISSAVTQLNTALTNGGIKMQASFNAATQLFSLSNTEYGSGTTVANTISSSLAGGSTNLNVAAAAGTVYNVADDAGSTLAGTQGLDVVGTIEGSAATGSGQFLTSVSGGSSGLKIKATAAGDLGTVNVTNGTLQFQIGAFANETVKLAIDDIRANKLGTEATGTTYMTSVDVSSIDVTAGNGAGAQDAIMVIDAALSQVNTLRSKMGSFQKDVLESTVRNLGVARQNMAASESNIRDADFADEMLQFSRAQILSQTSMSMLTQANQAAQQVLSLFR